MSDMSGGPQHRFAGVHSRSRAAPALSEHSLCQMEAHRQLLTNYSSGLRYVQRDTITSSFVSWSLNLLSGHGCTRVVALHVLAQASPRG